MAVAEQQQVIKVHGPYEDAIIAGCSLTEKIIEGQDAATKAELWKRHLEITAPLHKLAAEAMGKFEQWVSGLASK